MALEVIWLQEVAYPARVDRLLADFIFSEGVLTGFTVSERSGGANMSVDVAAGKAIVEGDDQANQGKYAVRSTATENVTGFTAPGSNSRYDIVVLRINDTNAGGSSGDNATIERIAGTAAASPVAPNVPDSAILLATIGPITSSTTSITDAMIADSRSFATLAYDVVDDAQATRLGTDGLANGEIVRRSSTGRIWITDGNQSGQAITKGYVDGTTQSSANTRYQKHGAMVSVWTVGGGSTPVTLAAGYRPASAVTVPAVVSGVALTATIGTNGVVTFSNGAPAAAFTATFAAA